MTRMSEFGPQLTLFPTGLHSTGPSRAEKRTGRRRATNGSDVQFCVLGSGSGGNSTVIRSGSSVMLIDVGLGPMTVARRLKDAAMRLADVRAVCLTHLDQDHFRPTWISTLLRSRLAVHIHRFHARDLLLLPGGDELHRGGLMKVFDHGPFEPLSGFSVLPIRLCHDQKGTCGFHVESGGTRIGYATDLGHVPNRLIEQFAGVDVLAIESNYDPQMQRGSGRPQFLQRRIMGRAGHLSNQQAFDAVRQIVQRSRRGRPRHIVLLHRSTQCNCPVLVRQLFETDPSIAARVTLAEQRRRTKWLSVGPATRRIEPRGLFSANPDVHGVQHKWRMTKYPITKE